MKIYIIGENPIVPHLIALLAKDYEIKVDCNVYTKDLDVEKLTVSDLTLKTNFVDVIFLVNTKQIHQKIILKDGSKTLNDAIFNLYQESLWFSLNMNSLMNYYVDKYDLKHYDLSEISPFYICSRLAFNEIVLQKMITQSQKLLHQQKVLILGYSTTTKLLCELLSSNRMIVVVSDRLLQELIEAKQEGYGILLKEEINTTPIHFDTIIIEDEYFINQIKSADNQQIYFINYKEENTKQEHIHCLNPYELVCTHYPKLIAQNVASSFKKEIREYFKEA